MTEQASERPELAPPGRQASPDRSATREPVLAGATTMTFKNLNLTSPPEVEVKSERNSVERARPPDAVPQPLVTFGPPPDSSFETSTNPTRASSSSQSSESSSNQRHKRSK